MKHSPVAESTDADTKDFNVNHDNSPHHLRDKSSLMPVYVLLVKAVPAGLQEQKDGKTEGRSLLIKSFTGDRGNGTWLRKRAQLGGVRSFNLELMQKTGKNSDKSAIRLGLQSRRLR